ncbi:MAG: SH3 domain-containing protein [Chloroflexota bacterium]
MRRAILIFLVIIGLLFLGVFFFFPSYLPEFLQPPDGEATPEVTVTAVANEDEEGSQQSTAAVTRTPEESEFIEESTPEVEPNEEDGSPEPVADTTSTPENEEEEVEPTIAVNQAPLPTLDPSTPVPESAGPVGSITILDNENGEPIITAAVRRGPNVRYRVIDLLRPGTTVEVLGKFGEGGFTWYLVRTPSGNEGWVSIVVARPN